MNPGALRSKITCETNSRRLHKSVLRKRLELSPEKRILEHDNACAHEALRFREFYAKKSITKMDHPPYSPDSATNNFWLFQKLKIALKGQRFAHIPDIQCNVLFL
jgi:hypothetical protein